MNKYFAQQQLLQVKFSPWSKVFSGEADEKYVTFPKEEAPAMTIVSLAFRPHNLQVHQPGQDFSQLDALHNAVHPSPDPLLAQGLGHSAGKADHALVNKVQNVAEAIDAYLATTGVNLKFSIDERMDVVQVEVRDPETDRLIRKIPADEMLDLAAAIEHMMGVLFDRTL